MILTEQKEENKMKLSRNFVSDYVDLSKIDTKTLAEKMVFAGNEYEEISKISPASGLVVGKVLECEMHPESTKLHICKIDLGDSIKQIICGAPNIEKGQKVIVARVGAKLPGGEIKKAKLAGMESEGMVCSLAELGLDSKYVTEEDKKGIHVLEEDAEVGSDALAYLGLDDEYIDFELTSNRADLMSVLGMAYEIGAILNEKVKTPKVQLKETKENICDSYKLSVQTKKCPIYLGKLVHNVTIKESPKWMKERLMASGMRPINNVVDISNYVMLEYGQPLHFFDADKLGNHVIVRNAKEKETLQTLDTQERVLDKNDIVIANEEGPVCLAGVMGGMNTEVEMDTKNIFIEAAIFDSYSIRTTSKKILKSEASIRYEKGIDPNRTKLAIERAAYLLQEYAGGTVTKGILTHDEADHKEKVISITLEKINQVLGMEISKKDVKDIFTRLGFQVDMKGTEFIVTVPTRRLDISIKEDLIEEVGRIYGYDHVKGHLPLLNVKRGGRSEIANYVLELKHRLASLGLTEVITYSLGTKEESNSFTHFESEDITLLEPLSEDKKVMRKSLIPSLLKVFEYNLARKNKDVFIYEAGSIYYKKEGKVKEEKKISGLLYGTYLTNDWKKEKLDVDFYLVKGILENVFHYMGFTNRYEWKENTVIKELHPGRSVQILVDGKVVGYMGQVHPNISKKEVYVFELSVEELMNHSVRMLKFKEVPKYPSIQKDLAFVMKKNMTSKTVMDILKHVGGKMLNSIDVFDVYVGENVKEDEKSIAYSLTFQDPTRTLTDEEVMVTFKKMIEEVEKKTSARVRDK